MTDFSMDGRPSCQSAFANLSFIIRDSFALESDAAYWFGANARLTFRNMTGAAHEFTFSGGTVQQPRLRIAPRGSAVVFAAASGGGGRPLGGTMVHVNSGTQSDVVVCPNAGVAPSTGPARITAPEPGAPGPRRLPRRVPHRQGPERVRELRLSPGDRVPLPNGCIIEHDGERILINCPRTITP